jgi:hypothetical protein
VLVPSVELALRRCRPRIDYLALYINLPGDWILDGCLKEQVDCVGLKVRVQLLLRQSNNFECFDVGHI